MATIEDYTCMQKEFYESATENMKKDNHNMHNNNPEYWNILLAPLKYGNWNDSIVLDFACGTGRNVENILKNYNVKEAHGCDISSNNIAYCESTMGDLTGKTNFKFFTTDGVSLRPLESNTYDFIMSTIALEHICVYEIRYSILEDMFRVLRPGGMISIQMGFGARGSSQPSAKYYDNVYDAKGTNSRHDVRVDSPDQIQNDLDKIGFENFEYNIGKSWHSAHQNWIYFRAWKPREI